MKYKLLVKEGSYKANNLFILLIEIFKHRFHHLVYNKEYIYIHKFLINLNL